MKFNVQADPDTGKVWAIYISINEGKVHRTVEIVPDACYADEDRHGNLLGVEMLAPGTLIVNATRVARKYGLRGFTAKIRKMQESLVA